MCELFAMSSARPTVVEYTLDRFAAEGGERHRNRDGWGIVFAEDRDAHVYREPEPAADSALARMVIERDLPTRHLMAHVRRASRGHPHIANTHPFSRVIGGRAQHFAHNGTLHGIDDLAPELRPDCVGDTDSELAFLILLREMESCATDDRAAFDRFAAFCARMSALGSANFLYFDGRTLFAHAHRRVWETPEGLTPPRPPGLHIRHFAAEPERKSWSSRGARIDRLHSETVLLASVPLNDEGWEPLAEGEALALREGRVLFRARTGDRAPKPHHRPGHDGQSSSDKQGREGSPG